MRSSDLQGKRVCDRAGRLLGRLHELRIQDGVVTSLTCGRGGVLQRLGLTQKGTQIPWSEVVDVTERAIVVTRER